MILHEDILDNNEKILWSKMFPPRDLRPNKKKALRDEKILISLINVSFIAFIIVFTIFIIQYGFTIFGLPMIILILGFSVILVIQIRNMKKGWKKKLKIYSEYLKIYKAEELENYSTCFIITNKKILTNGSGGDTLYNFIDDQILVENTIMFKKDFLVMNLEFLYKILIGGGSKRFYIEFRFDPRGKEEILKLIKNGKIKEISKPYSADIEEGQYFNGLTLEDVEEITKILLEINPNLVIEK